MSLSKPEYIAKKFNVKSGTICLRTDGIITFEPNPSITKLKMEYFIENLEVYKILTKGSKKPFLTDNRIKIEYDHQQKAFMKEQLPLYFNKVGVIINSSFNQFIFNSFMYLYRPAVPIKSFHKIDTAIDWLNQV